MKPKPATTAVKPARKVKPASRPKGKPGRPPKYDPAKLPQVYELARRNQPDLIIARRIFGCARQVLVGWKSTYSDLRDTISKGHADYWQATVAEVECALTKTAKGEAVLETGTNKDGTTYVRFAQPNVAAQVFILCNRKAFDKSGNVHGWRNVQRVEVEGGSERPRPIVFVVEGQAKGIALDGSAAIVREGASGNGHDGPKALEAEKSETSETED